MIPGAIVRAAKAKSCGGLSRKFVPMIAKGSCSRHITLPPGSVRGNYDGYHSVNDDDAAIFQSDSRPRMQLSMTPMGSYYGTLEVQPTPCSPSRYEEDYDAWDMHTSVAGETADDLGALVPSEYDADFVELAPSLHQISFPTENSDAASAPFPVLEESELKEYMSTFYDGGMDSSDDKR